MLLLHQAGSVKIGEVVRYTVTYTPAHDRILPSPTQLHLKIKNTSAIALRAAFVHGPYTLYAAAYPATFNPNAKFEDPKRYGVPEFEPNLKAGGTFSTELFVPEDVRQSAGTGRGRGGGDGEEEEVKSVTWVVEVSSQVIFSTSAGVHYEILLGRDEKSLSIGYGLTGNATPTPGQVSDHQQSHGAKVGYHNAQPRGIYSKAIKLRVDDTASLWNTPRMPEWDDDGKERAADKNKDAPVDSATGDRGEEGEHRQKRQKKVHLVVLTHGLHSNLGADMLFLKESIDAAAKQAKIDARLRKSRGRSKQREGLSDTKQNEERKGNENRAKVPEDDDDEEEVIVRGFSGNAVRTERGIKYLGKRLAKYVLQMTYPDQPYRPVSKKSAAESLSHALKPEAAKLPGKPAHHDSTIIKEPYHDKKLAYKITSISFIAHSLGGLVQTYAVAYIQKHSPTFFDIIEPINFISMASPFLGLSNENPLYVKFALDFGLVGRTGQDLGLTWRAPTLARSGWGAIVGGLDKKIEGAAAPESKPLLRVLPTGPAHIVLKKFRNRTVYSNVVNDGIVPLRTSCLLFLDWQGLGRVEKARRENGLVGTMAGWGWAELTGQNSSSPNRRAFSDAGTSDNETGTNTPTRQGHGADVPQPPPSATLEDNARNTKNSGPQSIESPVSPSTERNDISSLTITSTSPKDDPGPLASIIKFFTPVPSPATHNHQSKSSKIYKRSQTLKVNDDSSSSLSPREPSPQRIGKATSGNLGREDFDRMAAPPRTTFFESAGDLLKPPLPPVEFLINPESRQRTIFHDRVYHPEDIPPPPLKRRSTNAGLLRRRSSLGGSGEIPKSPPHTDSNISSRDYDDTRHTNPDKDPRDVIDSSAMKVEEKIARAYHRDLSWRKVLVRLEPDAHNNMIVRRMFSNAYGWPVVKHLCDTHFGDSEAALTRDEDESNAERAKDEKVAPDVTGKETKESQENLICPIVHPDRTDSEAREASDEVPALHSAPKSGNLGINIRLRRPSFERTPTDSDAAWSERDWADSENDSDEEELRRLSGDAKKGGWNWTEVIAGKSPLLGLSTQQGTEDNGQEKEKEKTIDEFLGKKPGTAQVDAIQGEPVVQGILKEQPSRVKGGLEDAITEDKQTDTVRRTQVN